MGACLDFLEVERVRRHLSGAERAARERTPAGLSLAQRRQRALMLDELAAYRRRGRFPKNRDFRARLAPVFVDEQGTRCAVAHLLGLAGRAELVERIRTRNNHVRVKELVNDRDVVASLSLAGLTLDEAARIQPGYCTVREGVAAECLCGSGGLSMLEVTVVAATDAQGSARARVDAIHGPSGGLTVGGEVSVKAPLQAGQQLWVSPTFDTAMSATPLSYTVTRDTVTCSYGADFALTHPVPKDVALRAFLSAREDPEQCKQLLAELDPRWLGSTCDPSGCSCRFSPRSTSPASDLAAVAVLGSILLVASARRRWAPRPR